MFMEKLKLGSVHRPFNTQQCATNSLQYSLPCGRCGSVKSLNFTEFAANKVFGSPPPHKTRRTYLLHNSPYAQ